MASNDLAEALWEFIQAPNELENKMLECSVNEPLFAMGFGAAILAPLCFLLICRGTHRLFSPFPMV